MYRSVVWYFAALLGVAVAGFWPSYFAAPAFKADFLHVHFHGLVMFAWCALLIAQAWLIRGGLRRQHRALGKLAFVLVPAIVVSTFLLAHYRLRQGVPPPDLLYFFYVQLALLAFFVLSFTWAMAHRREPALHMRYMTGTAFSFADPIFARILLNTVGVEPPLLQAITYGAIAAALAALMVRERANGAHARVWGRMLAAFAMLTIPTFFVTQTQAWSSFAAAFARLPLP